MSLQEDNLGGRGKLREHSTMFSIEEQIPFLTFKLHDVYTADIL